ncbi:MAG: TlpA family protein disulfide reductase [Acidobacteria bacterium]|nr:TlpA family protein disulfide reductase [Acidobacteriota bacterium]
MKHRSAVIAGIVGVALAALVLLFATASRGGESTGAGSANAVVGKLAPPLSATTLDGRPFDLDKLRGKWVLVNFFATWCPPCVAEHPELVKFSQEAAGRAEVVSVPFDDTPDKIREFFAENGGSWPVLAGDTGDAAIDFGVVKLPESFLVDPQGKVVAKIAGGVSASDLERRIDVATGGGT